MTTDVTTLKPKGPEVKGTELLDKEGMEIIEFKHSTHLIF